MRLHWYTTTSLFALLFTWAPSSRVIDNACAQDESLVQIVLHAMAAPRPALKYQLLPTPYEQRPGNAAVFYGRVKAEQRWFFNNEEIWENIERAQEAPLDEIRDMEHILLDHEGTIFPNLKRGGQCRDCDWQYPVEEDGFNTGLPDVPDRRLFARLLMADARKRIALGDFDGALRTIKVGYAMARHTADAPFLVTGLIAKSICDRMSECVLELIQQPDAPNLYWALTYLPEPFLDLRRLFEGEILCLHYAYPQLRTADYSISDPDYWRLQLEEMNKLHQQYSSPVEHARFQRQIPVRLMRGYPLAKRALIERGMSPGEVEAMAVGHAIMLHSKLQLEEMRDEYLKYVLLPYWQAKRHLDETTKRLNSLERSWGSALPYPSFYGGRSAFARLDRRIAVLRVFEAIRLHGAAHGGRLPEQLQEIEVPVPSDPITGKPFEYAVRDNVGRLKGPTLHGEPCRYEITLRTESHPKGE